MNVSIEYCGTCNYRPRAAALSLAIQEALGVKPLLVHSAENGTFKIIAEGEPIFSKLASGNFPSHEDVIARLRSLHGPA